MRRCEIVSAGVKRRRWKIHNANQLTFKKIAIEKTTTSKTQKKQMCLEHGLLIQLVSGIFLAALSMQWCLCKIVDNLIFHVAFSSPDKVCATCSLIPWRLVGVMEFFPNKSNVSGGSPQTSQGQERPPGRVGSWRISPNHLGPAHACRPPTRPTPAGPAEAWRSRHHGLTKVIEGGVLTENPSGTRAPPQHVVAQRRKLQLSSRSSTSSNLPCGPFLTYLFVSHVIGPWPRHILFRTVLFLMFFFFRTLLHLRFF